MVRAITAALLLSVLSAASWADAKGFSIGAGGVITTTSDCSRCDTSGGVLEAGVDFNRFFGIDAKIIRTTYDDTSGDIDALYAGVNIGHTFNTRWLKVYAKVGFTSIKEKVPGYQDYSDDNAVVGVGGRITPWGDQSRVYFKFEVMASSLGDNDIGIAIGTLGYKF